MNYEIRIIVYYISYVHCSSHHSKQSSRKCLTRVKFLIVRAKKTFMEFFHEKEQWSGPKRERFLLDVDLIKEDGVVGDDPWWEKDKRQSRKKVGT